MTDGYVLLGGDGYAAGDTGLLGCVFDSREGGEVPGHRPVQGPCLWQKPVAWLFLPSVATLLSQDHTQPPLASSPRPQDSGSPCCLAALHNCAFCLQAHLKSVSSDDGLEWCGQGSCCLGQGAECGPLLPSWHCGQPCLIPLLGNIPSMPWASLCVSLPRFQLPCWGVEGAGYLGSLSQHTRGY